MLSSDISCFENSVDSNQLASEKPADQDLQCFPLCWKLHANKWNPESVLRGKLGWSVAHENIQPLA